MNKRGIALVFSFIVIIVLSVLGTAFISRSISESRIARRCTESTEAFWLAEAGVNQALRDLRNDYTISSIPLTSLGGVEGQYSVTIIPSGQQRIVNATGYVPNQAQARATRTIQAMMTKVIPPGFYDSAIYSAGNITINGAAYNVTGNVTYATNLTYSSDNINGSEIYDPNAAPLAALSYEELRAISQAQGNYFDEDHLNGPFPEIFWYDQPNQVPNVVFLEGPLKLAGNDQMGGFIIVGGEVEYNATVSGTVSVDGCIYTRYKFTANGGGAEGLNINGGVWAGSLATINGGVNVAYNETYMNSILNMNITAMVQISSWRDTQNPYLLQ